jgi:hypothetical protein
MRRSKYLCAWSSIEWNFLHVFILFYFCYLLIVLPLIWNFHLSASYLLFVFAATASQRARGSSFTRFLDHTQRRTTVGRTPLDEWSARRRELYLTSHNTHNRQTTIPPVWFDTTISTGERPQTHELDIAETVIRICCLQNWKNLHSSFNSYYLMTQLS